MSEFINALIPYFKALHIVALSFWCGGLITLPLMISRHHSSVHQGQYEQIMKSSHLLYTLVVTPAAVITVIVGTWLVFMRETFTAWFFTKLLLVMLLVASHAWTGHLIVRVNETSGTFIPPKPLLPLAAILLPVTCILTLVLGKPALDWVQFPSLLNEPLGAPLPLEAPRW